MGRKSLVRGSVALSLQNSSGRFGWRWLVPPHPGPLPQGEGKSLLRVSQVGRRSHWHRALRDSRPRHPHDPACSVRHAAISDPPSLSPRERAGVRGKNAPPLTRSRPKASTPPLTLALFREGIGHRSPPYPADSIVSAPSDLPTTSAPSSYVFSAVDDIAPRCPRPRQSGQNKPGATCKPRPTLRRNLAARTARRAIPTLALNTYPPFGGEGRGEEAGLSQLS